MTLYNLAWWIAFFIVGVIFQSFLTGVDFLLVGVVISLQERKIMQSFWVIAISILLQEGLGTLPFGSALLWYISVVLVFFSGRTFFESENFVFIMLVSLALGLLHFVFTYMMANLHKIELNNVRLLVESGIQVLITPPCWRFVHFLRGRALTRENRT